MTDRKTRKALCLAFFFAVFGSGVRANALVTVVQSCYEAVETREVDRVFAGAVSDRPAADAISQTWTAQDVAFGDVTVQWLVADADNSAVCTFMAGGLGHDTLFKGLDPVAAELGLALEINDPAQGFLGYSACLDDMVHYISVAALPHFPDPQVIVGKVVDRAGRCEKGAS